MPLIVATAVALAAVLASSPAGAEPREVRLSLEQILARAEADNPDLLAQHERADAAAAGAEAVDRMDWPRLTVSSGLTRSNTPATVFAQTLNAGEFTQDDFAIDSLNAPDGITHLTTVLSLEIPVDVLGKAHTWARGAAAGARAATAGSREWRQELRLRVVTVYRQARLAREAVRVTQSALEGARAREADIEARVAEGAALRADLLRARARRREREADLADRRGDVRISAAMLARLVGGSPDETLVPSEAAPAPEPLEAGEDEWRTRAAERPMVEAVRERLEAARWGAEGQRRAAWPDLGIVGQIQDDRNDASGGKVTTTLGAFVRWNAFDAGRSRRRAEAEAQHRAAQLDLQAAQAQVRLEVAAAFRRAQAARERYAAAAGGAEEGREALRVVQERRREGLATLTDELETETAALMAELQELRAATEAAIADAALRRAAGVL